MAKKLKMLEENKFITRSVDRKDKRIFRFSTTQKAQTSIKKVGPIYEKNIAMIFEGVKNEELDICLNIVKKCLKNLSNKKSCTHI